MLSEEIIARIAAERARYPEPRAACVEALRIVQARHGWVCDDHLRELAGLLEMSPAELDAVATFYSLIFRRPVGRHVILFCDNVVCWMAGGERLRERLGALLGIAPGETTATGRFTLLPAACLGGCHGAPALLIDGELHTSVEGERLDALLERYP